MRLENPVWKLMPLASGLFGLSFMISACIPEESPEVKALSNLHALQESSAVIEVKEATPTPFLYFPLDDDIWIVDHHNKMWKSSNFGDSWETFPHPSNEDILSILIDHEGMSVLLHDSTGQLHRTHDGGKSWTTINLINPLDDIIGYESASQSIRLSPGTSVDHLYLIYECELFYSADRGSSWAKISPPAIEGNRDQCVGEIVKNEDNVVTQAVVAKNGNGWWTRNYLFSTNNGGQSWRVLCSSSDYEECPVSSNLPYKFLHYPFDMRSSHRTDQIRPLISSAEDALREGKPLPDTDPATINMLVNESIVERIERRLWYRDYGGRLTYSNDNGRNWHAVSSPLPFSDPTYYSNHSIGFSANGITYLKDSYGTTKQSEQKNIWIDTNTVDGEPLSRLTRHKDKLTATSETQIFSKALGDSNWQSIYTFDGEIVKAILEEDYWWVIAEDSNGKSSMHYSTNRGATWKISTEVYNPYHVQCSTNYCVIATGVDLTVISNTEGAALNVQEHLFSRVDGQCHSKASPPEKYNESGKIEDLFWSEELNTIWVVSQGAICKSTDSGESWEDELAQYQTNTLFQTSPQGKSTVLLQNRRIRGESHIVPLVFSSSQWHLPGALPGTDISNYFGEEDPICWMDENKAVFRIFSEDEEELYYATNDAGMSWSVFNLEPAHNGSCTRWQNHLQIGDNLISFK